MSIASRVERSKLRRKRKSQQPVQLCLEMMEDRTVPAQAVAVGPNLTLIAPGPNSGTKIGETLYFIAHQSTDAPGVSEVWQVSGSAAAEQVDIPALAGMAIDEIDNVGGMLYVTASPVPTNAANAVNLWRIDPTAAGGATELTKFTGSGAANLQAVGNQLLFEHVSLTGDVPAPTGAELWVSDGTTTGTQMVYAFTGGAIPDIADAAAAGNDLYFQVTSISAASPPTIWVSDGTAAGTQAVTAVGGGAVSTPTDLSLTAVGNDVYFAGSDGKAADLWQATNGQASIVQSFAANPGDTTIPVISGVTSANGNVYFAVNRDTGSEVWTSDGTAAGTTPVYQPSAGAPAAAYVGDIAVLNGSVYFTLVNGGGLMEANGQDGAAPVPLPAGLISSASLAAVGNRLYFQGDDGVHGTELWTTDGTSGGTIRLTDINPGSGSAYPIGPEEAGGALYVVASDGIPASGTPFSAEQLWMLPDPATPAGAATTTTLSSSASAVGTGGSITLTATVTATDPTQPTPTGSVVFRDDTQIYGSAPIINGTASLAVSISTAGTHNLVAVYTGDNLFDESISAPTTVAAGLSGTTLALTSSSSTVNPGQMVTFTATVTPTLNAAQPPTGSVSFFDGTTFLGTGIVNGGVATFQTSNLSAGVHAITAVYGGDLAFSPSSSAPLSETVGPSFTVVLSAPPSTTSLGNSLTLTAHVSPAPGGSLPSSLTVIFRDAATPLGTAPVNAAGVATLTISSLSVGSHSLSAAIFNGDTEYDSSAAAVTVHPGATSASVRSTAPTARTGQAVTLTLTIALPSAAGLPIPTGTVTFKDGSTVLGTALVANDRGVLLVSNLAVGAHSITATYSGDMNFAGSSAAMTQTVTPQNVGTTVVIQPIAFTAIAGQQIALSATVTPAVGVATPDGSVTFRDGTALLGAVKIDPTGHALLLINTLGTGNHAITATFGGSGIFAGSVSAPVTVAVRLGANAMLAAVSGVVVSGQPVALTATVAATTGSAVQPAGNVTFYDGTVAIGSATLLNGVAKITTNALTVVGTHQLKAVYTGNGLFAAVTTSAVYLTVRAIVTTTAIAMPAAPAAGTGMITLTASVNISAPSTGHASGNVTFLDGTTTLGSANVAGGLATLHLAKLAAGSHYIRAVFRGTGAFAGSSSNVVHYTIAATTSTTLQATAAAFGQTTNLKATVTILSPGFSKANGKVVFMDGLTVLGSATLVNGIASLGVKLATGAHHIVATYEGTSDFAASAAVSTTYAVTKASPALVVKATPVHPQHGANVTVTADIGPAMPGAAGPTGTILLLDGTTIIGVGAIVHGAITVQTTKLTKGTHLLKATYAGDGNYVATIATLSLMIG